MEKRLDAGVFYCKDCGQLDYSNGVCSKCGSKNVVLASQDISLDNTAHDHLMKVIYAQHENAIFNKN